MLNFLAIKVVFYYIAILGRTKIGVFQVVASTYHLKIKFPSINRVGPEKCDQRLVRSCYVATLRPDEIGGQILPIEDMDVREEKERGKSAKDLILIALDVNNHGKVTYVGASLHEPLKGNMITFLQENNNIFLCTMSDMP